VASATAGIVIGGREFANAALGASQAAPARRRVMIGGRRVTVIDIHAHTFVPEVWDLVKDTPLAAVAKINLTGAIALGPGTAARLQYMDKEVIDYQAINVNAWGYSRTVPLLATSFSYRTRRLPRRSPPIPIGSSAWPHCRCSTRTWPPSNWMSP